MDVARGYTSPLRAEQAAATRDRIVDATVALLQHQDVSAFGMQDVADRAGVAVRTVYRAFPTKDDLIAGVLDTIRQRFESSAGSPPTTAEELQASVGRAVGAVFELEPLYRAVFATASGREQHSRMAGPKFSMVEAAFAEELAGLDAERVQEFVAVVNMVTSSRAVLFLKDYAGLDVDRATAAVSWTLAALVAAIRDPTRRIGSDTHREGSG